jgi:hypothetical protein
MLVYILAEKTTKGFKATEVNESYQELCSGVEYGDIFEGEIQIWEYPTGKIYSVVPDRTVSDKKYYSLPDEDLWEPQLKLTGRDKSRVRDAYILLTTKPRRSILSNLLRLLRGKE